MELVKLIKMRKKKIQEVNNSSNPTTILLFILAIVLFFFSRLSLRNIINFPNWIYITLPFVGLSICIIIIKRSRLKLKKIDIIIVCIALSESMGLTIIGITNQIYMKNQKSIYAECKIIEAKDGGVRYPGNIWFQLDNKKLNKSWPQCEQLNKITHNKSFLAKSYLALTYKKGILDMYVYQDAILVLH